MKSPKHPGPFLVVLSALLLFGMPARAQSPSEVGTLTISADGFKSSTGTLVVRIFRQGDNLFGPPFRQQSLPVALPQTVIEFRNLPYATYSVLVFQDLNDNGQLDHDWKHLPNEPLGWSNHWRFNLLTGMPTFGKTKFAFSGKHTVEAITLK